MLVKLCNEEKVDLVNIVRRQEHADLLKAIGATYVCNSSVATFMEDLTDALAATGATLAFDAIGGGKQAGQILTCMEAAATRDAKNLGRYGSTVYKQVYIYGGLDRGPTEFNRNFGMTWGIGAWLLTPFLQKIGADGAQKLRERVAAGDQDHVRQPLHQRGVAGRGAAAGSDSRLRQASHGREVPDPPEHVITTGP